MIKRKGDLFSSTAPALGHGCNVQGKMAAGIANAFRIKFPKNYTLYHNACSNSLLQTGESFLHAENGIVVVNMATQFLPGPNATYPNVFAAALDGALQLDARGIDRLAVPLIGCGIGGLEWPGVEYLLRAVEIIVPNFEFEVWKL